MRRFTRRRRKRTEWVKVQCATGNTNFQDATPFYHLFYVGANPVPHMVGQLPCIIGDGPGPSASMLEERKSYTIQRIVGRHHFELQGLCSTDGSLISAPLPAMIRWGFCVFNVNENGNVEDTSFDPFTLPATGTTNQTFAEWPWLWVDTAVAGSNQAFGQWEGGALSLPQKWFGRTFPGNNQWGAVDRTKIDVASKRRIGENERLYFCVAYMPIAPQELDYASTKPSLTGYLDCRILISWNNQPKRASLTR